MSHVMSEPLRAAHSTTALYRDRHLTVADEPTICSWVQNRAALQLISGDSGEALTPEILDGWLARAAFSIVITEVGIDAPVGFCTISRLEIPRIPPTYLELCHLVVDPRRCYHFVGSRLCRVAKSAARDLGFRYLCARISPTNRYALALARQQRAEEFTSREIWLPSGFRWFRSDLAFSGDAAPPTTL